MSVLEIKKFKDPVLKKKAEKVERVDEGIKRLANDMINTMKVNGGVGLAAPQVGVLKRVITVQTDLKGEQVLVLINPEIIKKSSGKDEMEEGCLSFPGVFLKIKRVKEIELRALDINGKAINLRTKGFLAKVFQHEIDHLKGIVFFKRLSFINRIKYKFRGQSSEY